MDEKPERWDETTIAQLARRLDAAASSARDPHELLDRLGVTADEEDEAIRQLGMAFHYVMRGPAEEKKQDIFDPMIGFDDGTHYPPPLREIPDKTVDLWDRCVERLTAPLARARLHDLCFERRWGSTREHAREAVSAYLEVATGGSDRLSEAESLVRALDLCRRTGQDDLAQRVIAAILGAIHISLAQTSPEPGVSLMLLGALARDRSAPSEVDDLLQVARTTYIDAYQTTGMISLQQQRARGDTERIAKLNRELVEAWVQEAARSDPLVRILHLDRALQLANQFGFRDLVEEVSAHMQATKAENYNLRRVGFDVEISTQLVEQYFAQFINTPSWQEAFLRLLSAGPPTGNVEDNRRQANEIAKQTIFLNVMPTVIMASDGLPRYKVATEEDKAEFRLSLQERQYLQFKGPFVGEALRRILEKWGPIDQTQLCEFFQQQPHVDLSVARSIARAFENFGQGDFEAAAYVAVPRVETLVRAIVLALGLGVYRVQRQRTPGQYPGLGALLPELREAGLDPSWIRFLSAFLASPMGANYRNELSHGFLDDVGVTNAALVLLAVLYLAVGVRLTKREIG